MLPELSLVLYFFAKLIDSKYRNCKTQ